MDKGARWATVHGMAKSRTPLKWLSTHACTHTHTHTHTHSSSNPAFSESLPHSSHSHPNSVTHPSSVFPHNSDRVLYQSDFHTAWQLSVSAKGTISYSRTGTPIFPLYIPVPNTRRKWQPTQYSYLAWWTTVHGVTESCTWLSDSHFHCHQTLGASQVGLVEKNPPANAGDIRDTCLIPGLVRSLGEGHGNPLQYSCLETKDRGAWQATVCGVTKGQTWLKQLSTLACTHRTIGLSQVNE